MTRSKRVVANDLGKRGVQTKLVVCYCVTADYNVGGCCCRREGHLSCMCAILLGFGTELEGTV